MRKFIMITALLGIMLGSIEGSWFGSSETRLERGRRVDAENRAKELEQQLNNQRKKTDGWQIAAGSSAVAGVILLSVGAALGAKARRDGKAP